MHHSGRTLAWASSASPAAPARLVRGEVDPLMGWHSPADLQLVPAWTFGWTAPRGANAAFATHFAVHGRSAEPRVQQTGPARLDVALATATGPIDLVFDFAAGAVRSLDA